MSKTNKELVGTYRMSFDGATAGDMATIVFRKAGTVEDTDVCVTTHGFAVDITTKLRTLAEESAYRLACIKRLVTNHVKHNETPISEIIEAWEEARQIIVASKVTPGHIADTSKGHDPLLAECVEMLKAILDSYKEDMPFCYIDCDKILDLLARCGKADSNVCEWHKVADCDYYDTGCGHAFEFIDAGPKENHFEFCSYCGRKIEVNDGNT